MSIMCCMFIPAYIPQVQDGSGTRCFLLLQNALAWGVEHAAFIDSKSSARGHTASNTTLGVHSAPLREVMPSIVQFQARYAVNGSMYVSGTFVKSTPYLAWGNTPPRLAGRAKS